MKLEDESRETLLYEDYWQTQEDKRGHKKSSKNLWESNRLKVTGYIQKQNIE